MNLQLPPEPGEQDEEEEEVIELEMFADVVLDGVTSGADPTTWEPIRLDNEETQENEEDVLDTSEINSNRPVTTGVTSGNDSPDDDPGKSGEHNPNRE